MDIYGRTFLVTGGASGLGAACGRELHDAGGCVVFADHNEPAGDEWQTLFHGDRAVFSRTDVTSTDDISAAIELATVRFGTLSGAISCAGILAAARLAGRDGPHDLELFCRVIQVNLVGTFNVMRLVAQHMTGNVPNSDGERGIIVNTASVAAMEGQRGQAAYAAAKGGVASLTLPCARDLASYGIRVVAIAPGVFQTPMIDAAPPQVLRSLQDQTIFPARLGQPAEFARLVRHVIENPMLNGCILRLDGAMRMGPK
jgi:NAD(P)-dependent dehydrogenase (short-subunit alcohol dehydrogenase family)